jgi:hypothetical protein
LELRLFEVGGLQPSLEEARIAQISPFEVSLDHPRAREGGATTRRAQATAANDSELLRYHGFAPKCLP